MTASIDPERPHNPWVFRSVLDQKPRMITLALHNDVWASYDTQNSSLYKVWKGGVTLDGAVYTTAHGPQPSTLGDAYFVNSHKNPWHLELANGKELTQAQYKGHQFNDGHVALNYELQLTDDSTVDIQEQVEYIASAVGTAGIERVYTVNGMPEGAKLKFKTNYNSVYSNQSIKTDGNLSFGKVDSMGQHAELLLNNKGSTRLAILFSGDPEVLNSNKIVRNEQPLGLQLINKNDCRSCHNEEVKTVGPSYLSIAKRYNNTAVNVAALKMKIKLGGAGNWGKSVMNAHPDLEEDQLAAMVFYIMKLKQEEKR